MEIGNRLAESRKNKHLSQKEFSDIFNISTGAVGMWETNKRKPDIDMIISLATFYNVSTDYILCQSSIPSEQCKTLSHTEQKILTAFSQLTEDNQDIIIGKTKELLKEQLSNEGKNRPLKKAK